MIENVDERIRQRAYEIWEREGRPEGRHEEHWALAREEIAIEDNIGQTLKPNPSSGPDDTVEHPEPVEPLQTAENLGEDTGGPTNQSEEQPLPKRTRASTKATSTKAASTKTGSTKTKRKE